MRIIDPEKSALSLKCCRLFFLCLILILGAFRPALGVTCHCFRDRSFQPAQPASADPYLLATARNSLVAAASGIDKGTVVRQRMTGATEADLWLSSYLSTAVGVSADQLLDARDRAPSWTEALDALRLDTGRLGKGFNEARRAGDGEGMARALADPVLARTFNAGAQTLQRLKMSGADIAESTLSLYLGSRLKRTPESILDDVRNGKRTWGELFNTLGVRIESVGDRIAEAVAASANEN